MNDTSIKTLDHVRQFLNGLGSMEFRIETKAARYPWIQAMLLRFHYPQLCKAEKGFLLDFLQKVSGYSRIQVKRLTQQSRHAGQLRRRQRTVQGFRRLYTLEDIRLLAQTDELHGTLSGPATKKLCERAWGRLGQAEYARLAGISVSYLYVLRRSSSYRQVRQHFEKTRPTVSRIGERRQPQPNGRPGYLRVDTVHQGDLDGVKGVYHINAVDEVTQFEIVCSVEKISERYLIPVLEDLLEQFPFLILAFHADNGSEYINKHVVTLLNKLLIELTKSRARHCNDNALVESKNGAIIRKQLGYVHISQQWAPQLNAFHRDHLNPYINFHRPCFFPVTIIDAKGKTRKRYPYKAMMTPYEKFTSLSKPEQSLKPERTLPQLEALATVISDHEAAKQLKAAKHTLYQAIFAQQHRTA